MYGPEGMDSNNAADYLGIFPITQYEDLKS